MVKFMQEVANTVNGQLDKKAASQDEFELKDLLSKYTLDSMASSVFGVEIKSFDNPDSPFITYAKQLSAFEFVDFLKVLVLLIPGMAQVGKMRPFCRNQFSY